MRNTILRVHAFGGVLIASLALSGFAQAGQYVVNHLGLKPSNVNYKTTYTAKWDDGLRNVQNDHYCFNAGIYLPHGVTITKAIITYSSGASTNGYAILLRNNLASSEYQTVADAILTDDTGKRKSVALPLNGSVTTVDNSRYSYGFGLCLGRLGGDTFYALRIVYTTRPQPPPID